MDTHAAMFQTPSEVKPSLIIDHVWLHSQMGVEGAHNKLLIRLQAAAEQEIDSYRIPVSIILVIDQSRSMYGESIAQVVSSTSFLLRHLREEDRLSIILFNEKTNILMPLCNMTRENKENARTLLSSMNCHGSTDVYVGLLQAIELVEIEDQYHQGTKSNHHEIWLFTDGFETKSTDSKQRFEDIMARNTSEGRHIPITSFSLGSRISQETLLRISTLTGGSWYQLNTSADFLAAVGYRLGGMLSLKAHDVTLKIKFHEKAGNIRHCHSVYLSSLESNTLQEHNFRFHDLFSEEIRDILLDVSMESVALNLHEQEADFEVGDCTLRYHVHGFHKIVEEVRKIYISRSRIPRNVESTYVRQAMIREEVVTRLRMISRHRVEGNQTLARHIMKETVAFLKMESPEDSDFLKELTESLEKMTNMSIDTSDQVGRDVLDFQHELSYQRHGGRVDTLSTKSVTLTRLSSQLGLEAKEHVCDIALHQPPIPHPFRSASYKSVGRTMNRLVMEPIVRSDSDGSVGAEKRRAEESEDGLQPKKQHSKPSILSEDEK